jgi:hypothetical protein
VNLDIAKEVKDNWHPPLLPVVHWDEKDTEEYGKKKKRITVAGEFQDQVDDDV